MMTRKDTLRLNMEYRKVVGSELKINKKQTRNSLERSNANKKILAIAISNFSTRSTISFIVSGKIILSSVWTKSKVI
jgi:hypothetical protein